MEISSYKMEFGWEEDNGIGEMLINQIINGEKTATCALLEEYTEEELAEVYDAVGNVVTVYDKHSNERCRVRLLEVFETTFGQPDLRLVRGEGDGENIEKFQKDHLNAWKDVEIKVTDDTVLVVELFELIEETK
ncbi:MAG: hypothetical protein LRY71_06180 [Bacillaceae bacterium]|nr:hypothetical protein [Bacillaceae bacterium]